MAYRRGRSSFRGRGRRMGRGRFRIRRRRGSAGRLMRAGYRM